MVQPEADEVSKGQITQRLLVFIIALDLYFFLRNKEELLKAFQAKRDN